MLKTSSPPNVIDHNSPLPLYYQLKRILEAQIESGELAPGDILPTEQQLQTEHNISRTTVRQALGELQDEGKLLRQRGRGTFVAKPKIQHNPESYPSLTDSMMKQGVVPGWQLLSAQWETPPANISSKLQIATDESVFCLERLRLENDDPIGYHIAYVPKRYTRSISQEFYIQGNSLAYLNDEPLLETCMIDRKIEAVPANEKIADYLDVEPEQPLLRIERVTYSQEQQVVEVFIGYYRGDRFQYQINNMRAFATAPNINTLGVD